MLKNLFVFAICGAIGYCAMANDTRPVAAAPDKPQGYALASSGDVGGLWVQRDYKGAFGAVYSHEAGGDRIAVIGLSRNQKGDAHDFAIVANGKEVYFQVRDAKGEFHFIPVEALVKLADKDAKVKAQPMGAVK